MKLFVHVTQLCFISEFSTPANYISSVKVRSTVSHSNSIKPSRLSEMYKHSYIGNSVILRGNVYLLKTGIRLLFRRYSVVRQPVQLVCICMQTDALLSVHFSMQC